MDAQQIALIRDNDKLSEQNNALKAQLEAMRTALTNTQAVTQMLVTLCQETLDKARHSPLTPSDIQQAEAQLAHTQDTDWLAPLYEAAVERGFNAGYAFCRRHGNKRGEIPDALDALKAQRASWWPGAPHRKRFLSSPATSTPPPRYRFDAQSPDAPFDYDDTGPYTDYQAYADLLWRHDLLKEELDGYRQLARHTAERPAKRQRLAQGCDTFVRRPQKTGILKAQLGRNKGEQDFFVLHGPGVPRCDRALIFHALGARQVHYDYQAQKPTFEPSLLEELIDRGYDLRTLRFSVSKPVSHNDA